MIDDTSCYLFNGRVKGISLLKTCFVQRIEQMYLPPPKVKRKLLLLKLSYVSND